MAKCQICKKPLIEAKLLEEADNDEDYVTLCLTYELCTKHLNGALDDKEQHDDRY